jgi:hypothetical protein
MASWVKYVGTSGARVISSADWRRAGLEEEKGVSWDRRNGWTVDISELSDKAQELILQDDELIQVSDALAEQEQEEARRMPRDQRVRQRDQRVRIEEHGQAPPDSEAAAGKATVQEADGERAPGNKSDRASLSR